MLSVAQKLKFRKIDPYLAETLEQFEKAINSIAQQTGADPKGVFQQTPQIAAVNVTAANGIINVQIIDNAFVNNPILQGRAITYFVEIASDAGFKNVIHAEAWHAARNQNILVGNQTVYVRAYSQLQGSPPSLPVASAQNPVAGGGALVPPIQQAYQGSGTSLNSGQGYGTPLRSPTRVVF